ncbi:hypothetical protein G7Z17_g2039 [Cylindrodendrum hubeiense]|uniref:DUF7703 domain-containing protein n=1 Tax=Cylindrodendrum hubeiense TaxID=595255 RepID=A0A9P5LLG3_9HYPO|nr:hypothetical protein G7Z17_g2039 [Cylindrodendrum hubeiense]
MTRLQPASLSAPISLAPADGGSGRRVRSQTPRGAAWLESICHLVAATRVRHGRQLSQTLPTMAFAAIGSPTARVIRTGALCFIAQGLTASLASLTSDPARVLVCAEIVDSAASQQHKRTVTRDANHPSLTRSTEASMAVEGYRGGIDVSLPIAMTIAGFFAISVYNVFEINVQIFLRFRKRTGLYFWSLIFASWGIVIHSVGFVLQFFQLCRNDYANIVIITLGGVPMVIGFAVVLYSRLHLIIEDRRKIRWVLIMILLSFLIFTIPPTILNFGSNSPHPQPYIRPFEIYEKVMLFGFSAQEVTISGLYLWEARKMLRIMDLNSSKGSHRVMKRLIYVNILVILLDLSIIGTELGGVHVIQTTYKSAVYSVKLKLEFPVLNQLRSLVKRERYTCECQTPHILSTTTEATSPSVAYTPTQRRNSSSTIPFRPTYQLSNQMSV